MSMLSISTPRTDLFTLSDTILCQKGEVIYNKRSRTHITDEVEIHDDRHLPEAGVVLPGGAGHVLGLALGL